VAVNEEEKRGRVLFLTSNFPRWKGDQTTPFIINLADDLVRMGWSVDVLAPHAPGAAVRERIGDIDVYRFRYLFPESQETVCYSGGALANLRKNPVNYLKLPFLVFAELFALLAHVLRERYDVVHTHWILPQGFCGAVVRSVTKVPHVLSVHGSDVFALGGRIVSKFKSFSLRRCDAITVNSTATEEAVRRCVDGQTLSRIPMGVDVPDMEAFAPSAKEIRDMYRGNSDVVMLFVGRLVREKGVDDFISAAQMILAEGIGVTALLIGEGPERMALEAEAKELGVSANVHFLGWIEHKELPAYMAAADVLVGPSMIEGQGLVFAEALMAGVPVVATNIGGITDIVIDGETGLLVEPGNPEQIRSAVMRLRSEPGLKERVVASGRRHAEKQYTREATATAFSGLYEEVINRGVNHRAGR